MKIFRIAALLCGLYLSLSVAAQAPIDTLEITDREDVLAKIIHPNLLYIKRNGEAQQLINAFIKHLESIKAQIPLYQNYQMYYELDHKLRIEEGFGTTKYRVENGQIANAIQESKAILKNNKLLIELYFSTLEDLLARDYALLAKTALANVPKNDGKRRPFKIEKPLLYTYSYTESKLVKNYLTKKGKAKLAIVVNASVGLFKNKPVYEYSVGTGIQFGNREQRLIYGFIGHVHQFVREEDINQRVGILGIAYKLNRLIGIHIAAPINDNMPYSSIDYRLGITTYPFEGLSITTFLYQPKADINAFLGISVGYGF